MRRAHALRHRSGQRRRASVALFHLSPTLPCRSTSGSGRASVTSDPPRPRRRPRPCYVRLWTFALVGLSRYSQLIDTLRKNGEAPASPESPATVPESDSDAPLEAAEAPDPTPAPAPATRPQGISNNDDAPAWAHSPSGDHSPRARRNAWGAASTSGLPSWASTPPTEPEPSWAEDGIRPPKV